MPPKTTLTSLSNAAPEAEIFLFAEPATPAEGTAITLVPPSRVTRPLAKEMKKSANKDKQVIVFQCLLKEVLAYPLCPPKKES